MIEVHHLNKTKQNKNKNKNKNKKEFEERREREKKKPSSIHGDRFFWSIQRETFKGRCPQSRQHQTNKAQITRNQLSEKSSVIKTRFVDVQLRFAGGLPWGYKIEQKVMSPSAGLTGLQSFDALQVLRDFVVGSKSKTFQKFKGIALHVKDNCLKQNGVVFGLSFFLSFFSLSFCSFFAFLFFCFQDPLFSTIDTKKMTDSSCGTVPVC